MISILNKIIILLIFLFQFQETHAQIYTNNQQYLNNPYSGFERKQDVMKKQESLTIKTNILYFKNDNGQHLVSFSFYKDNSTVLSNVDTEIFIRINTKKMIAPFDGLDQTVILTILGLNNNERWQEEFHFNKRQAYLSFLKTGEMQLDLVKFLSPINSQEMQKIFQLNKELYFQIEGLQGQYDFVLTEPVVNFYKQLFDYRKKLYKK